MSKYSDAALRALLGLGWIVMTIRKRFRVVELLDFHGQRIPNIMVHDGHHFNVFVLLDLLLWCVLMHWLGQVLWYKVYIFIYLDPKISSTSVCSWHPMFELVQSSQSTASYSFTIWITSRHRMFYHLHTVVPMLRTNMRKSPQHRELSILASGISLPHLTLLASPTAQSLMKFDRETAKRGWWFSETNDSLSLLRFWASTSSYPQSLALIIMGFEIKKQNAICINPKGSAKSMNCSSMSNFRARWRGGGGVYSPN
jgi:hypothetical protein